MHSFIALAKKSKLQTVDSGTLSVGAVNFNNKPAHFSGSGTSLTGKETQPDIVGYGVNIFSSLERDINNRSLYKYMSGTSMAAPYVTGIAALYASADANLQGKALRQHLIDTALPLQAPADRVGAGLARFKKKWEPKGIELDTSTQSHPQICFNSW